MWIAPVLLSSFFLGFYFFTSKPMLRGNALAPAIFLAMFSGTIFYIFLLLARGRLVAAAQISFADWNWVFIKSALVAGSFFGVYYGLRELPLSIASPLRSASPLLTFFAGIILFQETPTTGQVAASAIILLGYFLFSRLGEKENISFVSHSAIHYLLLGTALGAASALYDKYLFGVMRIDREMAQLWFTLDLTLIFGAAWGGWRLLKRPQIWRWNHFIALNGIALVISDAIYFYALTLPAAPISLISVLRRGSVIVTFVLGAVFLNERNIFAKAAALAVVLAGVILLAAR